MLLFGEHAAVYGYPAVGTSLPLETVVMAGEAGSASRAVSARAVLPEALHDAVAEVAQRAGGTLGVRSSLPHGMGLGSSAALCVALSRAAGVTEVWAGAHRLERAFHGSPSGADTGLAAHTGVAAFRWQAQRAPGDRPLPSLTPLPAAGLHLVFGAVARAGSTAANVRRIAEARAVGDARVHAALEELGCISAAATEVFSPLAGEEDAGDDQGQLGRRLGDLATVAQRVLSSVLGLGDEEQDRLLQVGLRAGAAGGKLSGGGGGGAFVLFCESEASAKRVFEALTSAATGAARLLCQLAVTIDEAATGPTPRILRQVGVAPSDATWRA